MGGGEFDKGTLHDMLTPVDLFYFYALIAEIILKMVGFKKGMSPDQYIVCIFGGFDINGVVFTKQILGVSVSEFRISGRGQICTET